MTDSAWLSSIELAWRFSGLTLLLHHPNHGILFLPSNEQNATIRSIMKVMASHFALGFNAIDWSVLQFRRILPLRPHREHHHRGFARESKTHSKKISNNESQTPKRGLSFTRIRENNKL